MKLPVRVDPRYHDAVIFRLDGVLLDAAASAHGATVSASTVEFLRRLRSAGIATSVYSTRGDGARVLEEAGVADLFVGCVDGCAAEGTPPLADAAKLLGARPDRCAIFDSTEAGVAAGRDGGFALVVGFDRTGHAEKLRRCGADVVIGDLVAVSVRLGYQRLSTLDDALDCYGEIASLVPTRRPVVLLDFDGTVSEIVDEPDTATLTRGAAEAIRAIAKLCPVAILSGRTLPDIKRRVGLTGVWYAGSHGVELVSPEGQYHEIHDAAAAAGVLDSASEAIEKRLARIDGVLVENKHFAVAVHYRNVAAEQVPLVLGTVRVIGQAKNLRVTTGRKAVELRPNIDWDKGKAVDWIINQIDGCELMLPLYVGDDLTDEDAFDVVRQRGIGVIVRQTDDGDRPTAARFAVDDPAAVCRLLQTLTELFAREQDSANSPWKLTFVDYDPSDERRRETLCTVGNGYMATRGSAPEMNADANHYPATYVAGVFNRLSDKVAGIAVDNESVVNLPNWLPLTFRIDGGEWFGIDNADLLSYVVTFDLRRAVLVREFRFRDNEGRVSAFAQRRFVAMHAPHLAAMETVVRAENWSGRIEFRSIIDGDVVNGGVQRYRDLSSRHLNVTGLCALTGDSVLLEAETVQSRVRAAVAVRTTVRVDGGSVPEERRLVRYERRIGHDIAVDVAEGQSVRVEKVVTLFTGRDHAISEPATEAARELDRATNYADLQAGHQLAWAHLWERMHIEMDHDVDALRVVRLHQLHLLQTLSPHTADLDVGVPARGLHGEAYRGHVFWDELFVFPVTNLRLPKVTKSLLIYRYRRMPEARRAAAEAGYAGAMFPWQSGSDGREESQQLHLNPRSGRWNPDSSARAHHVGIAIAYNVWQYYQITGDIGFLIDYGAEMLAEIARFWVSLSSFDPGRERYVIRGVIGPDEFHSGYPGRDYDGIDNNAYTNIMAVWVILRATEAMERMPLYYRIALLETLGIDGEELARWEDVSLRMYVPFHDGVISQFEGYEDLEELDWCAYRERYRNMQRLDRILEAENDSVNKYKASKQADALMLFYLLSSDELYDLLNRLGYRFSPEQIPKTIAYYQARTSHGSTLSAVVHAWVLARGNRREAMHYFGQALAADVADIQHGTTAEGIHLAAMTGSIDLLQRCFTGLEIRRDRIVVGPLWPKSLGMLAFSFRYRGHRLHLSVIGRNASLSAEPGDAPPVEVECRGRTQILIAGKAIEFTD